MKNLLRVPVWGRILLISALATPLMAPVPINMNIPGVPGSSEKQGRAETIDVFSFDHEVYVPTDALGRPTGTRIHGAVAVLKQIDKSSPRLHQALANGNRFGEITIDWYRIDPTTREETKYYVHHLKGARIVSVKTLMPTSFDPAYESYRHLEEVKIVYESIIWEWIPDRLSFEDGFGAPAVK